MSVHFNKAMDIKLITLVKESAVIYNTKHPKYSDCDYREVIWQKIGDTLNRPALEFAGIQCQIQHGDFQEENHKPGLIENLNEYLPVQYSSSWGAERKILKLHKKHAGLSQLAAKHLYTKTARDLPTYGVTFFVVKEKQKGKKKLVPRLLGISSEAILRLNETSKEVMQAWPLTQVMTYHASHNDTFSLNFGDYSEKEYCVKTNDAYRIRDILEGYIDIIKRRQGASYGAELTDSGAVFQENVQRGGSNVITHVTHLPSKAVEQCYIGPSRIIQEGQASESSHGTQIVNVQQMVTTQRCITQQQVITGELIMRRDMTLQLTRKLNKMNANSVQIVTFLSDPTPENIMEVHKMLAEMEADMPNVTQGVREIADNQETEDKRNKELLGELEELQRLLDTLFLARKENNINPNDVQNVAKQIADLTTRMYLNLDPRARKQSHILRRSRQSFIADDKAEANLRRASFMVAAGYTCGALDNAKDTLTRKYDGPEATEFELRQLEDSVVDKLGEINAAIAMLLTTHSDFKHPDYSAAVVSLNTINEFMPELAKDAKALSSAQDSECRQALLADFRALCNSARQVCALVGTEDKEKMQEATNKYSELSGSLIFRFGRNPREVDPHKSDEIIDLAKEAVATTTILLMKANELSSLMTDHEASARVDAEGVRCGDAAKELLACAQLTAPSIHQPHCQSAITAATENLSSSSQTLAMAWRPMVEDPSRVQIGEDLRERTMDVAKALDRLRNAYANLKAAEPIEQAQEPSPQELQRLSFITSASNAQGLVKTTSKELDKPLEDVKLSLLQRKEIESSLTQKIAQVNAAVASLLQAMTDLSNPDSHTAELAVTTISELMPTVVQDIKILGASTSDKKYREALLDDMKALCQAINVVCAGAIHGDVQELNDSAQKFAKASQKLSFVFSPRADRAREQLLLELSSLAYERATVLVDDTNEMADIVGGANATSLRGRSRVVDNAARVLSATAQLSVPHIEESLCRSALLSSTDALSSSAHALVSECQELQDDETCSSVLQAKVHQQREIMKNQEIELESALQGLRDTCLTVECTTETQEKKIHSLKFVLSLPTAHKKLESAEAMIYKKPTTSKTLNEVEAKILKDKLEKELATLKSAVALLIQANSDPHRTDFSNAEQAICTITDLMPSVIDDTKAITNGVKMAEDKATLDYLKALNDAVRGICAAVERDDAKDLGVSANKLAEASENLTFVFQPRNKCAREQQLLTLCVSASAEAERVVEAARRAAEELHGVAWYNLKDGADWLGEAADALVTTAKLTSSSINDRQCKTALTSSVDHLLLTVKALGTLAQASPHIRSEDLTDELKRCSALVEDTVNKIKQIANAKEKSPRKPPPLPLKKSTLTSKPQVKEETKVFKEAESNTYYQKPNIPVKAVKISDLEKLATQDFIDTLRAEESSTINAVPAPAAVLEYKKNDKIINDNKKLQHELIKTVRESEKEIKKAIDELQKNKNTSTKDSLSEEQKQLLEKSLEEKLAFTSVAAASLIAAIYRDFLDYNVAIKSIHNMSTVIPEITKDVVNLSYTFDDKNMNALKEEAKGLCEAARKLCSATQNETQKFNEAAEKMGDSIGDPEQEKHVIAAAKAIGDSAYRMAVAGANVARGADETHGQAVCETGSKTAQTAGVLVYTAKDQLIAASEDLSSDLASYTSTFKTLPAEVSVPGLMMEANNLEKLLHEFRKNLGEEKLVKRKVLEKLVIEDTALRQMTVKILQDAKAKSESTTSLQEDARHKFKVYCNKLTDAIKSLDVANHKCHQTPNDLNKRKELETSIQMLQLILLHSRPTFDEKLQNNVVDLTDFVKDVSAEAEKLTQIVNGINIKPQSENAIMVIKDECNSIKHNALCLMNPAELPNRDHSLDGILEVDQFGQDTENRIARIKSATYEIENKEVQIIIQDNVVPMSESINLLRFSSKSALAVARSAALNETLNDLKDLQKNIGILLTPIAENDVTPGMKSSPSFTSSQARLVRFTMEVSRGSVHALASTVAAYVIDAREVTLATHGDRLKQHVNEVIESLKLLIAATSTRIAMFEAVPDEKIIKLTLNVLKVVENYEIADDKVGRIQIIKENDVIRLLLPKNIQRVTDQKKADENLQKNSAKFFSLIGTFYQSMSKPDSLIRTVKNTVDTAAELANIAKSLKTNDITKDKKIDDNVDDMIWTTFGLLKATEYVSADPKNDAAKTSLLDACRLLNDSINKLARTANPTNNLKTQCSACIRALHIQEFLSRSYAESSVCAVPYAECLTELEKQHNVLMEAMQIDTEKPMSCKSFSESLRFVTSAVCNSTKFAAHSAYLLLISESNKLAAIEGIADVMKLRRLTLSLKESALIILRSQQIEQVKPEEMKQNKLIEELNIFIKEISSKISDEQTRRDLVNSGAKVDVAVHSLKDAVYDKDTDMENIYFATASFLNAIVVLGSVVERPALVPQISQASPQAKAMSENIMAHSKELLNKTKDLMANVLSYVDDDDGPMSWVTFNTSRRSQLDALEKLINCQRKNGEKAGVIVIATTELTQEPEAEKKSYLQNQTDTVNKWLSRWPSKPEAKTQGEQATRNIIYIGEKMLDDLKGQELEEIRHILTETEELLKECSKNNDTEKAGALKDKVDDLRKAFERSIVSRVVDDFTEAGEPMADLEKFVDVETDAKKRKFMLEQKIAELLAQLAKVTKTARVVGSVSGGVVRQELERSILQTELLAPQLVKAAEERVRTPQNEQVVANYRSLLAQYAESLCKVQDMCDRAVDPMYFVQTAGEKMQRLREESHQNPQRCAYTSIVIRKLANRVIDVGMSSSNAKEDVEIMEVLSEAKKRLVAPPPPTRASTMPDWRTTTADILRATGEVESVLGGESIFKKQPEPDKPIYNAAFGLHTVVREWSARDNEVVAVAKRMAVLMAKLSDYMNHDKKAELIATSKSIVVESHEVARLARKLALECSDIRIKTNLLQACERIPTISGQLKMLTTVKDSSLGHQRSEEDKEAMDMLVGNAQNLMLSVEEVLKGAESASVKIASQRGMRIKWVRKNYY